MWVVSQNGCAIIQANKFIILPENELFVVYANDDEIANYPNLEDAQAALKEFIFKSSQFVA